MLRVSIIIPVYNVEKYLGKCLDSCLSQNLRGNEYEIIVVNDGSPDNCHKIIEDYEIKYSNIIVINKPNGGLSSARNAGLKVAKGEYVWFVDSDDWIEENMSETLRTIQSLPEADVYCFDTNTVDENGEFVKKITRTLKPFSSYSGMEMYNSFSYPFSAVQFNFWKRTFLIENNLWFKEGALYDDWQFILRAYALMNKCVYLGIVMYNYRIRTNTISTCKKTFKHMHDCIETAVDYIDFVETHKLERDNELMLYKGVCKMIADSYRISLIRMKNSKERQQCLEYFFQKKIWWQAIAKSKDLKAILKFSIMFLSYKLKL